MTGAESTYKQRSSQIREGPELIPSLRGHARDRARHRSRKRDRPDGDKNR